MSAQGSTNETLGAHEWQDDAEHSLEDIGRYIVLNFARIEVALGLDPWSVEDAVGLDRSEATRDVVAHALGGGVGCGVDSLREFLKNLPQDLRVGDVLRVLDAGQVTDGCLHSGVSSRLVSPAAATAGDGDASLGEAVDRAVSRSRSTAPSDGEVTR